MNCAIATAALGHTAATTSATVPAGAGPSADSLGEIAATGTRLTNTVNEVLLTIAAVTQEGMDSASLKDVQELARTVSAPDGQSRHQQLQSQHLDSRHCHYGGGSCHSIPQLDIPVPGRLAAPSRCS